MFGEQINQTDMYKTNVCTGQSASKSDRYKLSIISLISQK
jgi:hypothetical protein